MTKTTTVKKDVPAKKPAAKSAAKPTDTKTKKKSPSVPIMRCVGQLKSHLNDENKKKLTDLQDENKEYIEEVNTRLKQIKERTVFEKDGKTANVERTKEARDTLRQDLDKFKSKYGEVPKTLDDLTKSLYRISGPASKYLSAILHIIIRNLLEHSVESTLKRLQPNQKQQKVDELSFGDVNTENFEFYPIISKLKTLVDVQNQYTRHIEEELRKIEKKDDKEPKEKKRRKKADKAAATDETPAAEEEPAAPEEPTNRSSSDLAEDEEDDDKKKATSYRMVIYNIFKTILANRDVEEGKKLCCAGSTKTIISNLLLEYVERLASFLGILVGATAKANTINEEHIMNANKLMFSMYNSLNNYAKFEEQVKLTIKTAPDQGAAATVAA